MKGHWKNTVKLIFYASGAILLIGILGWVYILHKVNHTTHSNTASMEKRFIQAGQASDILPQYLKEWVLGSLFSPSIQFTASLHWHQLRPWGWLSQYQINDRKSQGCRKAIFFLFAWYNRSYWNERGRKLTHTQQPASVIYEFLIYRNIRKQKGKKFSIVSPELFGSAFPRFLFRFTDDCV